MAVTDASYNGVSLGPVCIIETAAAEVARQVNAYPGINGLEVLNLGTRGGVSEARGVLVASDEVSLAALFQVFRTLQLDGGAYLLIDAQGVEWFDVILVSFRPDGPTRVDPSVGAARPFKAVFLHIDG